MRPGHRLQIDNYLLFFLSGADGDKVQKQALMATWWLHCNVKKKPHYQSDSGVSSVYLGWLMGLDPTTTGITILESINKFSATKGIQLVNTASQFAGLFKSDSGGLENLLTSVVTS